MRARAFVKAGFCPAAETGFAGGVDSAVGQGDTAANTRHKKAAAPQKIVVCSSAAKVVVFLDCVPLDRRAQCISNYEYRPNSKGVSPPVMPSHKVKPQE